MNIKVMYYSRSGNTKKVADAIAKALDTQVEQVPPAFMPDNMKLVFLGGGVYMGKTDKQIDKFIQMLDSKKVHNVALFGTMASETKAIDQMRKQLQAKGINVLEETFVCKGKCMVFFNRKHPDKADLEKAVEFAKRAVEAVK